MTERQYARWSAPFRRHGGRGVTAMDRGLTAGVAAAYPILLVWCWLQTGAIPWRQIAVPAASLVIVTLLRALIDRPRPYERMNIQPLMAHRTPGKSFPSRHAFSVFVLAVTAWTIHPAAGVVLAAAGILLLLTRVLGGVHYPSDVLCGAVLGIGLAVAGYAGTAM